MASHFKVKRVSHIKEYKEGDVLPESDFSLFSSDDKFVQFDYVDDEPTTVKQYTIKSGIFSIAVENQQMVLKQSGFTAQSLLEDYVSTKDISSKIDTFFNKLDIYKKYGMDAKRAILLYGAPGMGKSVTISKVCNEYAAKDDTTIVVWPSDKFEAKHVKDFIKSFDYTTNSIKKLILVIEDLGGVENADGGRRYSESSLLSLLDNVEKTFIVPTFIIATTNYPENFLENLTNRPQRFDDVIEVKHPTAEFRSKFLEFFSQNEAQAGAKTLIQHHKFDKFSVAHVKEVVIRSALYDITLEDSMEQLLIQSSKATKGFSNGRERMGFDRD